MKILCAGPLWRGSNAGGLFRALSREGCMIEVVDEFYFVSLQSRTKKLKIAERLIRPWQETEYNNAIKRQVVTFKPDVLLVYKGVFVQPQTLLFARKNNCKIALFYPDVSMTAHGKNIPQSIPLYDLIFTTKTFGIKDMVDKYGVKNMFFIPHGFDPDIHRPLNLSAKDKAMYANEVSFIGTWSPKKEKWLAHVKEALPHVDLKIWGGQWDRSSTASLGPAIQKVYLIGDLYAAAIQCSLINLAILSEQVSGASSGDLITSRTFHIPGANGFMLHERNEESVLYYKEDEQAGFFDGPEELVEKIKIFLDDPARREKIRAAGFAHTWATHSLDARAKSIIQQLNLLF